MFRVKICGLTNVADAQAAVAAGADAVGVNFYGGSTRFVEPRDALHLVAVLPPQVVRVGVFVNADLETVRGVSDALSLDLIQLHGDEPPEYVAELAGRAVMRAFRVGEAGLASVTNYVQRCREFHASLYAALLDAHHPTQFGGTGIAADWSRIATEKHLLGGVPIVLAGGLTADNVAAAIAAVHPDAVDVASGVESSPGRKDPILMQRFVSAATAAFES